MRGFFKRIWSRQFLVFLLFLTLSAVFWVFTTLNEDYQEEIAIPVKLVNVPEHIVVTTDPPSHLLITVRDKGSALLVYKYMRTFSPVTIDFESHTSSTGFVSILASELAKQVMPQFYGSSQIGTIRPQQVDYYYSDGSSKRVPVRIDGSFKAKDTDAYISQVRHTPDSVTVFAPIAVLDTITEARTERLFLTSLTDTTNIDANLQFLPGVKFTPSQVRLSIIADHLVEKVVSVPVRQYCFPANKHLRTFPSVVNITFQTGMNLYHQITADDFHIMVSYEDLLRSPNRCHLTLKSIPHGVRHVRITPADVDYVIEDINTTEPSD